MPRIHAPRPVPRARQWPARTHRLRPGPGKRSDEEEEPRGTERVESGTRARWRRISWARLFLRATTMAFGKSHRDPYATSVGHLIGKRAQGRRVVGSRGAFPTVSVLGLRSWSKLEAVLPLPRATLPDHSRSSRPLQAVLSWPAHSRIFLLGSPSPPPSRGFFLSPPGQ